MKTLLMVVLCVVLTACESETKDVTRSYKITQELVDCKLYRLSDDGGGGITVMRCPNSTTSTTSSADKSRSAIIVIDSDTYKKVEK